MQELRFDGKQLSPIHITKSIPITEGRKRTEKKTDHILRYLGVPGSGGGFFTRKKSQKRRVSERTKLNLANSIGSRENKEKHLG